MKLKTTNKAIKATEYQITVGETGNECGHVRTATLKDDATAVRAAKRAAACYDGDGWWLLTAGGQTVARGGRDNY